jgi:hypothetical protein
MQTVEFVSKLLPDGHLFCPQDVVRQLRVQKETQIRVVITAPERPMDRRSVVAQTFGAFKEVPTSSDLFSERKAQEKQEEARRWLK